MPELFLASNSPRRLELLKRLGRPFQVVSPDADEALPPGLPAVEAAELRQLGDKGSRGHRADAGN